MTKNKLLIAILFLCTLQTWGVEIFSRKLNTDNGLPDNNIRFMAQDHKGFIWMGTPSGLYRYDGYFYTTYRRAEEGNARLLNNNHITGIYNIAGDRLLISEQGNQFSVFDMLQNRFVDVADEYKQELYDETRKTPFDQKLTAPYRTVIENGGNVISDNLGNPVVLDNTGMIWWIDRKTRETIPMRVYDHKLFSIISSKKYKVVTSEKHQLIWVSTNGCGITVYDRKNNTEQHIRQNSGLISTDYIIDMCLDQDENVWVADEFHGVAILSTRQSLTDLRLLDPDSRWLRSNQAVLMHQKKDSTLIIANTLGQIFRADRELNISREPAYSDVDIHALCYDQENRPWIGSRLKGIRTGDGQWLTHTPEDPTSISDNNIYYMLCDRDGRIWAATEKGHLEMLEGAGGKEQGASEGWKVRHFFQPDFSARIIFQDRSGIIWVGANDGLYCFRPEELLKDGTAYRQVLTSHELNNNPVSCIYEDAGRQLLVGTQGSGLFICNNREVEGGGWKFKHYTTEAGLISNDIHAITEDQYGTTWIATNKGITCYDTKRRDVHYLYDETDLLRNYYLENSVCRLPDGRLAFGTNAGIVVYRPEEGGGLKVEGGGRLSITDVLINGVSVGQMEEDCPLDGSPDNAAELRLPHNQNSLTIRFSSFNYKVASTRYTYYLEGYDQGWSEPTNLSFASYKNLEPGRYVLHVKAYDNNTSSTEEKTLKIVIDSPWWSTWWAYLAYLLVAVAIGLTVYRQLSTIYRLRQRISIEKQLTEYKLQFFTNISHEFRTPLTIIRGAMERIKGQTIPAEMRQPVSSMDKSVSRMLRLINQLLEFRKMQNDKLRLALEETDVVKLLKDIFMDFRDMAAGKHINYTFLPQERSRLVFVDRAHLDKIVYNILSNAFKYTPSHGDIRMRVGFSDDKMQIRIEDTGVGIPKEKQPELFERFMQSAFSSNSIGIGLNLTKALVEVHHGEIRYEPNLPKGSVFVVELPTDKRIYREEDFLKPEHLLLRGKEEGDRSQERGDGYQELAPQPMNDRRVLVVEDDADVISYLRNILQKYFVVETAMDGVEALEILEGQGASDTSLAPCPLPFAPDLIISDVMMPVMDGLEFVSRIRDDERTKDIPVILLTALTSDEKRIKGIDRGADAYITKPFDPQLLITTAVKLIQKHDMLKEHYMQKTADSKTALPEIITEERDKHLLDVLNLWLADHISNPLLSVDDVAEAMGYRRTIFFKKMKALTGQTPSDYIKMLRMNRAAELLKDETITVSEVCYQVGISDPHYFAKVFKQQFGISPKKYQQGISTTTTLP